VSKNEAIDASGIVVVFRKNDQRARIPHWAITFALLIEPLRKRHYGTCALRLLAAVYNTNLSAA